MPTKTRRTSTLIFTNGGATPAAPKNARKGYTLDELYMLIGCEMVKVVPVRSMPGMILVVDEEGMLSDKAPNFTASMLAGCSIVGDALLCPDSAIK
jgi:hypothetical protein